MSAELSQEFADLALELLGDDGVAVTVTASRGGGLTASGDRIGAPAVRTALGLIFPSRGTTLIDGVEVASERVIITPVDPWPTPGERLTINGRTLVIGSDGAKTYAPQGIPIIHDLAVAS
jgi:hypothetical protein